MKLDYNKPVWVYRNLRHGRKARPLYSVMQNGRVLQRTHRILLTDVHFVVHEGGRQRVLFEKRKNVHAFVVGHIAVDGAMGIDKTGPDPPVKVMYNPYVCGYFHLVGVVGDEPKTVHGARAVLINGRGISAAYLE
jgi:hypothetical protein